MAFRMGIKIKRGVKAVPRQGTHAPHTAPHSTPKLNEALNH